MRIRREWRLGHRFHPGHQFVDLGIRRTMNGHHCAKSVRFDGKRQHGLASLMLRLQLNPVIKIEIAHAVFRRNRHLLPRYVVFVAVHDAPHRAIREWPAAAKYTVKMHGIKRFPSGAGEEWGDSALNRRHPTCRLSISRSYAIPDTPYVFPALPAFAVEESELQIIGLVAIPTTLDVDLVLRLKPAVTIDGRHKLKFILPPGQHIPGECLVCGTELRFEGQWMADA